MFGAQSVAFEAWLVLYFSECCWRTSTEKNTCGIARFPYGSTAFLYHIILFQDQVLAEELYLL